MTEHLMIGVEQHVGRITLNRPEALNALSFSMIKKVQAQLDLWATDDTIHAVVVDAVPGRAFCAGGDVRALYELGRHAPDDAISFFWHEYRLNDTLHHYKKPYVVLMNGITMGGGVGLALHGDYALATQAFLFAMPETAIGFIPDVGASYLLSRCPSHVGMYLGLTGARIKAAEAYHLGLVYDVIDQKECSSVLSDLMTTDLSVHPHEKVKAILARYARRLEETEECLPYSKINSCFNQSSMLGIMQALEQDASPWALDTYQTLRKKSPLSLCVTHALLRRATTKTIRACLSLEFGVAFHCLQHHDFYEGVRALLIDKDNTPRWEPATIEDVSDEMVARFFEQSPVLFA
ncbi:MAG: enoyl-CoA hydratase/isomerase family protein [Legionellaceae bacterium]